MKRIVLLLDGTWNTEANTGNTNVAKLDSAGKIFAQALIVAEGEGVKQIAHYHSGVGVDNDIVVKILGGAVGFGLKKIIKEVYEFLVSQYENDDEIYIVGFSRGSYAARALAGLIGASGIQRQMDDAIFEIAWSHYRAAPAPTSQTQTTSSDPNAAADYNAAAAKQAFHSSRIIKCVAVWDTVGSYGIPAGIGFADLARYYALWKLGFNSTSFGDHIEFGLHAIAVDEHRRPFVPTFWTIPIGEQPKGHVEQTWFAGAHCNVGGGYPNGGLSDIAMIWLIARIAALTSLRFDTQSIIKNTDPDVAGSVVDSTSGWALDHLLPHYRKILSPVAIHHGAFFDSQDRKSQHINEKVHWSAIQKRNQLSAPPGKANWVRYTPLNLPANIPPDKIASRTKEETELLGGRC